ncbi:YcgJ family protein [Paenochrobactrum sp. BZR 588]|uniref:YcgJ family protein n=1 Tax=Paenochrobactrum sp. BZR 588 TaxID=3378076 RepID=UPI0038524065
MSSATGQLTTPETGVLCDQYICVDKSGVSVELTRKHIGDNAAQAIKSQGEFDVTEFTFANGVYCDVKVKLCYKNRYFDAEGKRSPVERISTAWLFD